MNSLERVFSTFKMEKPDRIPFMDLTVDPVFTQKYLEYYSLDFNESEAIVDEEPFLLYQRLQIQGKRLKSFAID